MEAFKIHLDIKLQYTNAVILRSCRKSNVDDEGFPFIFETALGKKKIKEQLNSKM